MRFPNATPTSRPQWWTAALAVVVLLSACGSGGGKSHSAQGHEMAPMDAPAAGVPAAFARLDPAAFAGRMEDKGAVLINVHIPYEGEIEHTDEFIPYDHIVGDSHLPPDKNREVLLYCRTGRMSEIAGNALHAAGYTHLVHLEGGMRAWEASGRSLIHNPAHAGA